MPSDKDIVVHHVVGNSIDPGGVMKGCAHSDSERRAYVAAEGNKPDFLDSDGTKVSITGNDGILSHAYDVYWWPCLKFGVEIRCSRVSDGGVVATKWLDEIESACNSALLDIYDLSIANAPVPPQDARQICDCIGHRVGQIRESIAAIRAATASPSPSPAALKEEAEPDRLIAEPRYGERSCKHCNKAIKNTPRRPNRWTHIDTASIFCGTSATTPTFKNTKEAMLYAQRQGIPTVIPVTRRKCSKCGEDLGFNEGDPCGRCVN